MRIAVVSPVPVPRLYGGMDRLLEGLTSALRERAPTDLVTIPVDERSYEGILRGYYDFYRLDLSAYDVAISYKGPGYMIRHPGHVVYLSHRMRVFYDRYEPRDAAHEQMRRLIHWMDAWALDAARVPFIFTVGETVCRRLRRWGGIESTPLHHPTTLRPAPSRPGTYFLAPGRLHLWKRFDLIINAFRLCGADCPLKIVGEGPEEEALRTLAAGDDRIEFHGHVEENRLAELYAHALATIFPPIQEDMGLITHESFQAGKPVVTTTDSGEPALIVEPGRTGFVTEPTPAALAERLDWIWGHRDQVETMAEACRARAATITWEGVVDRLLEAGDELLKGRGRGGARVSPSSAERNGREAGGDGRIRLLVTDNQILDPPVGGGRLRIYELYRHLPEGFVTTYVGAFDCPGPGPRDQWLAPNLREIVTPLTVRHFKAHFALNRLSAGRATIDVTMPLLGRLSPRYERLLRRELAEADLLVGAHPWMFPFFPDPCPVPIVYDSQNCEAAVKGELLGRQPIARYLYRRVRAVERRAIERSRLILACSEADAEAFADRYGAPRPRIRLVPNGVDCRQIRPPTEAERLAARRELGIGDEPFLVFVGSNYAPNLNAADFIARALAPALPEARLAIVGGVGLMLEERRGRAALPPNVELWGFVDRPRLTVAYRAADLALNPMAHGSGTNIKMLDYMAAGLPIVATAIGARGLAGEARRHWREATLEEFVPAIRSLLADEATRRELAAHARELAEARYDWRLIAADLAEALVELVRPGRRRPLP